MSYIISWLLAYNTEMKLKRTTKHLYDLSGIPAEVQPTLYGYHIEFRYSQVEGETYPIKVTDMPRPANANMQKLCYRCQKFTWLFVDGCFDWFSECGIT